MGVITDSFSLFGTVPVNSDAFMMALIGGTICNTYSLNYKQELDQVKLKIAYNNGLKRLRNLLKYISASEMFVNLNIPSFSELLRKFIFSFKT